MARAGLLYAPLKARLIPGGSGLLTPVPLTPSVKLPYSPVDHQTEAMRRFYALTQVFFSAFLISIALFAQQRHGPLTDEKIAALVNAGVSVDEVLRIVVSAPEIAFDLSPPATDALLKAGASEQIIRAMAARESGAAVSVAGGSSPSVSSPGQSIVSEIGVYYQKDGQWIEMMPEVVNWKTGGVIKTIGTAGIVKGDVNGRIRGGRSRTPLSGSIQLLAYCPEGTQVTEYQLIRLRTHSNSREFRTVTGGIFHVSGDSNRDDLPFTYRHVAKQTWTIPLSGLQPGEYGLLPAGAIEARSASAQLGKMYTFTVVE